MSVFCPIHPLQDKAGGESLGNSPLPLPALVYGQSAVSAWRPRRFQFTSNRRKVHAERSR